MNTRKKKRLSFLKILIAIYLGGDNERELWKIVVDKQHYYYFLISRITKMELHDFRNIVLKLLSSSNWILVVNFSP